MFTKTPYCILFALLLLASCTSLLPANKYGRSSYESFYIGDKGMQYFIKPIHFITDTKNETLDIDFTFIYKNAIVDSATIRYTISSNDITKQVDSLYLCNKNSSIAIIDNEALFTESRRGYFISRQTAKCSLSDLNNFVKNDDWTISVFSKKHKYTYYCSNKSKAILNDLKSSLFTVINN